MKTKAFWKSKTFWVNLVALAASVGASFGFELTADMQASIVGGVMAAVNIVLRFVTKDAVGVADSES